MEREHDWMVHRFPRFHNKKESYILCFQTEMEAFLLLGKLVCQKSWCLNSSFPCQSQTFSSFPRCRARKRKQHERMLVKHSTALGCQSYCRKETHTVSLVMYSEAGFSGKRSLCHVAELSLLWDPPNLSFRLQNGKKIGLHWYKQVFAF